MQYIRLCEILYIYIYTVAQVRQSLRAEGRGVRNETSISDRAFLLAALERAQIIAPNLFTDPGLSFNPRARL